MSKLTRVTLVTAGGAAAVFATSGPAAAVDYTGDVVNTLSSKPVYDPSGALSNGSAISSAFQGEGVAVVALPADADDTLSASQFAGQIRSAVSNYDTVVVLDGTVFGVSSSGDAVAMTEALYTNMTSNSGDAGAAILASQDTLTGATKTVTEVGSSNNGEADGGALIGVGGGVLGVLALAAVGVFVARKLKGDGTKPAFDSKTLESLPADLRRTLETLERLGSRYRGEGENILADYISNILTHSRELFTRVKRKAGEGQYNMAVVKYTDTLKKLNSALGEDYYYDILKNPQLWSDSDVRKREVLEAVKATDSQIIRNIQQVNANEDLEIKVALESLSRSMEKPAFERLYDTNN